MSEQALLEVAKWAVGALEGGSSVEVHWLRTVAKEKHAWAKKLIADTEAALAAKPTEQAGDAQPSESYSESKYNETTGGIETRNDVSDEVLRKTGLELERPNGVHVVAKERTEAPSSGSHTDRLRHEVEELKQGAALPLAKALWEKYAKDGWSGDAWCVGEEDFIAAIKAAAPASSAPSAEPGPAEKQSQETSAPRCQRHTRSLQYGKVMCDLPEGHAGKHRDGDLEWSSIPYSAPAPAPAEEAGPAWDARALVEANSPIVYSRRIFERCVRIAEKAYQAGRESR